MVAGPRKRGESKKGTMVYEAGGGSEGSFMSDPLLILVVRTDRREHGPLHRARMSALSASR